MSDLSPPRRRRAANRSGFWTRLAHVVMARPVVVLVPLLVVLIGLGLPFLRVDLGALDAPILPRDVQSHRSFDLLQAHWGDGGWRRSCWCSRQPMAPVRCAPVTSAG